MIKRSIAHWSWIGRTIFIIGITDLNPIGSANYITKYAGDSSLLEREKYDVDLSKELRNVLKWVEHNKMQVSMVKTKEIMLHRPTARNVLFPSELTGFERVLI